MTRDEIIGMAREAGAHEKHLVMYMDFDYLERFASLVAAAERKACVKVCEELMPINDGFPDEEWIVATIDCAEAIRARSTK